MVLFRWVHNWNVINSDIKLLLKKLTTTEFLIPFLRTWLMFVCYVCKKPMMFSPWGLLVPLCILVYISSYDIYSPLQQIFEKKNKKIPVPLQCTLRKSPQTEYLLTKQLLIMIRIQLQYYENDHYTTQWFQMP